MLGLRQRAMASRRAREIGPPPAVLGLARGVIPTRVYVMNKFDPAGRE